MTEATEILTFHNDPKIKKRLLARIAAHEKADAIAQGSYEKWNGAPVRCAVGCSVRDLMEHGPEPEDGWHEEMERLLGVPVWLASLEDKVFESLPSKDAKLWPRRFSQALPIGADLDGLADRLAIRRLREECLPLSGTWPESIRAQVVAAIEQTIASLEGKEERSAAESAARAAWSAAESAAESAAWAAWSAAESAAWKREADRIVEELEKIGNKR